MMTILDSKVGSAYFGILVHMLIVIAYNSINCILLHICTYSHISQFRSQYLKTAARRSILIPRLFRERHCPGVYVPPSASISLPRLRVTGPTIKVCSLSPHAERDGSISMRDGSIVAHWNQWELGQDGCYGQNIQHLLVALALIDHRRVHPFNPTWRQIYAGYVKYAYK